MQNIIPNSNPPAWAERSRIDGDGIGHSLELGTVPAVTDYLDQPAPEVRVSLHRYDTIDVTPAGVLVTPGPVELFVGDAKLPIDSVAQLAGLLSQAVKAVERV